MPSARALLALMLAISAPANAAKVEKLAAPGWTVVNISPELANFYANEVARTLKAKGLKVVTAADIAAVLGNERQKALLGCPEDSAACMAELGAALGCDGLLVANLAQLGGHRYRGSLKVVSPQDGSTLAEEPVDAHSESGLLDALAAAAGRIARTLHPPPPRDVRAFALIPLVAGVAAAAGSAAGFGVAGKNLAEIPLTTEARAQQLAAEGRVAEGLGWALAGTTAAALTAAALVFFLSDRPALTPTVTVSPGGAAVGVRAEF